MNYEYTYKKQLFENLSQEGYTIEVTCDGYSSRYKGKFLGGASIKLPRERHLHWKHAQQNRQDNLIHAVDLCLRHKATGKG